MLIFFMPVCVPEPVPDFVIFEVIRHCSDAFASGKDIGTVTEKVDYAASM